MATDWRCTYCGRRVIEARVTQGLAGMLGRCPCSDRDGAPLKTVPVASEAVVEAERERRRDASALVRARTKNLTDEGRKKLTPHERLVLDAHEARGK